jgi:hypothetical protein
VCYSPTVEASEQENERFFEKLQEAAENILT